mgnify:CR=1 FL=1
MKKRLKKWVLRLTATILLIAGLLLLIVLNPILSYANKTVHGHFRIYHQQTLDTSLLNRLDEARLLLQASEFYDSSLALDICLNDGSRYPTLLRTLRGPAFAWGFYNKVVLQGQANSGKNFVELNGWRWNLEQLLAHEMVHCLQYARLGFWKSNPVADIPNWKWEGYAEYIARRLPEQLDLARNLERLQRAKADAWSISFSDSTIAPRDYYEGWTLVQYCLDVKKLNYSQLLEDTTGEASVREEMMRWYGR